MKDLVEGIAKALVDCPDEVAVEEIVDGRNVFTTFSLSICLSMDIWFASTSWLL